MTGVFVSDLHGHTDRYEKLFALLERERPDGVFLGGDLLPSGLLDEAGAFVDTVLARGFGRLRENLGDAYPQVFLILGNDDGRAVEPAVLRHAFEGGSASFADRTAAAPGQHPAPLWHYVHSRGVAWGAFDLYGYAYSPPSPFALKDWERYDVSRFVDPGCSSPEEGYYSVAVEERVKRTATIREDLERLAATVVTGHPGTSVGPSGGEAPASSLENAIFLFHAPPYDTALDRAALDDHWVNHVPLDVHVGSIAIRRFILAHHPRVTLHGHVHESAGLTGRWRDTLGPTHVLSAAHDGPELAVVRFDPDDPAAARRELV
jgi:Icc-related predicted phosphoesterase